MSTISNMKSKFAMRLGAEHLKRLGAEKLRQHTYFRLGTDIYLIVKASLIKQPFFGVGKYYVDLFDERTEESGTYYLVCLDSQNSGWLISKGDLTHKIRNGLSSSESTGATEYKIGKSDLQSQERFDSINDCRAMIDQIRH